MPLPTKTLREAAVELGIAEAELRAMIDMGKVRAVFKKGTHHIAPDEIAKLRRLRKTIPESSVKAPPPVAAPAKKAPPKKPPPTSMFGT